MDGNAEPSFPAGKAAAGNRVKRTVKRKGTGPSRPLVEVTLTDAQEQNKRESVDGYHKRLQQLLLILPKGSVTKQQGNGPKEPVEKASADSEVEILRVALRFRRKLLRIVTALRAQKALKARDGEASPAL
ncbi:MAG: hypothetical protein WDW38_007377 [Sanguina aurantia]